METKVRPPQKRYCPEGFVPGTVRLAMFYGKDEPPDWEEAPAYILDGELAVHESPYSGEHQVTHVRTGYRVPGSQGDKAHAVKCARTIIGTIDWSTIKRGRYGSAKGMTKTKAKALRAALESIGAL